MGRVGELEGGQGRMDEVKASSSESAPYELSLGRSTASALGLSELGVKSES